MKTNFYFSSNVYLLYLNKLKLNSIKPERTGNDILGLHFDFPLWSG